jgi:hypothetical protein
VRVETLIIVAEEVEMSHQLATVVKDCFDLVELLQSEKQHFSQNNQRRSARRLCERTEIFIKTLEDPDVVGKQVTELFDLQNVLESLRKLLTEIKEFVSQQYDHKMITASYFSHWS